MKQLRSAEVVNFSNLWLLLLLLVLSLEVYWIFLRKIDSDWSQTYEHNTLFAMKSNKAVGQIFRTRKDCLSAVRFLVVVPEGVTGVRVEFHLQRAGRQGKEYALQHKVAEESGWMEFRFPPIGDSGGYLHHFFVTIDQEIDPPVQLPIATRDAYVEGQGYGEGVPEGADLLFGFLYSRTLYQSLDLILAGRPFVFGSKVFLMIVFIAYNFAISFLFLRLRSSSRPAEF